MTPPEPQTPTTDDRMAQVLVEHQRRDAGSCLCGWSQWGASHAEHQWRMLKLAGASADDWHHHIAPVPENWR